MRRRRGQLRAAAATSLGAGVICQFLQRTDPTPPLTYFTVWSAVLATLVLSAGAATRHLRRLAYLRGAATVGTLVSALVFALAIAPATPTGTWFQPHDDMAVRLANVLLHGVGPALAAICFLYQPLDATRPWTQALSWCWWPVGYLLTMYSLQAAGVARVPYPFLDPGRSSGAAIAAAILGLSGLCLVLGRALLAAHRTVQTHLRN